MWQRLTRRENLMRLAKFGLVGLSGFVVNLAVFELFFRLILDDVDLQGLPLGPTLEGRRLLLANFAGLVVSIFTNFVLNDAWTWGDRIKAQGRRGWFSRLVKYYVSASLAGLIQIAAAWLSFYLVLRHLQLALPGSGLTGGQPLDLAPTLSVVIGIGCGMVINFLASHLWAFRDAGDGGSSPAQSFDDRGGAEGPPIQEEGA